MARRKSLVCQHLENISREALEQYQGIIHTFVRGRHGVYALYRRNKLYYVGLARNLRNRLKQHLKDRHGLSWDRFSVYLTIGDQHMRELESLIVRIVRPRGNKQLGKFAKSENLRPDLARRIRECDRQRLDDLLGRNRVPVEDEDDDRGRDGRKAAQPPLARYLSKPIKLRRRYKGRMLRANVRRDGVIRFNGRQYRSPSLAASVAMRRRTACNGWTFWTYERAPGDWVRLAELRK